MSIEQVSIAIHGPLEAAWTAMTDVEAWPEWTGRHVIEPTTDGTRLTLTVEHRGVLAGLVTRLTRKRTRQYLDLAANGLKASTEAAEG
jgi:hypothetical protein